MSEYKINSISYHKDPYGNTWSFEAHGTINTSNLLDTELCLATKKLIEDLKMENDQCLLEIERLSKLVDELQEKNDKLKEQNNNQATMMMKSSLSKSYYNSQKYYEKTYTYALEA